MVTPPWIILLTEGTFLKIHECYFEMQSESQIVKGFWTFLTDTIVPCCSEQSAMDFTDIGFPVILVHIVQQDSEQDKIIMDDSSLVILQRWRL